MAENGLVDEAGRPCLAVQGPTEQRTPLPVGSQSHVRHHNVGVQVGIPGPARPMPEGGRDEPFASDSDAAAAASTGDAGDLLEVGHGGIDRFAVGSRDVRGDLRPAESPKE